MSDRTNQRAAFVYFIRCEEARAMKIGRALNPEARLGDLQVACPLELRLYAAAWQADARAAELDLHRRFARQRLRGEWFRCTDELRAVAVEMATEAARALEEALLPPQGAVFGGKLIKAYGGGFTWRGAVRVA